MTEQEKKWIDESTGLPVHYHEKYYGSHTFYYRPCHCGNNAFDIPSKMAYPVNYQFAVLGAGSESVTGGFLASDEMPKEKE